MQCGEAAAKDTTTAFEMTMHINFVKSGQIEFLYTKDSTKEKDGFISGVFQFYIDQNIVLSDSDLNDDPDQWKYFQINIQPGMREISFIYQKYNSLENKNMQLELKV